MYENPQPAAAVQPVVRSQSFLIATLRRDAAQLIARLGLSQKEVERLALEADKQLAEEAGSRGAGLPQVQLTRPHTSYQGPTPTGLGARVAGRPYPEAGQRRPTTAPQQAHANLRLSSVGGSPEFGYRPSPLVKNSTLGGGTSHQVIDGE